MFKVLDSAWNTIPQRSEAVYKFKAWKAMRAQLHLWRKKRKLKGVKYKYIRFLKRKLKLKTLKGRAYLLGRKKYRAKLLKLAAADSGLGGVERETIREHRTLLRILTKSLLERFLINKICPLSLSGRRIGAIMVIFT
jgi:hypothetical protein